MSYAVIKTGGKQYRVQEGQTLLVERLGGEVGATVELQPLLVAGDGDPVFEGDGLASVTVKAEVVAHERGPKLRVFKFKPKRGYRRRTGHRQELTRIRVTGISSGAKARSSTAAKAGAAKPRSRPKKAETEEAS
jgi:large subunit ribosomal protein L21